RPGLLRGAHGAVPPGHHELGGAAPAGQLKRQAGPVEPPVEGVQPGPPDGPGPAVAMPAESRSERHQVVVGLRHATVVKRELSRRVAQFVASRRVTSECAANISKRDLMHYFGGN